MRAYEVRGGGIAGLTPVERPDPRPGPGQVLVRIRATSLNYRDVKVAEQARRPRIPLSDGAGEVVEVGPGVTTLRPGDRVAGAFFQEWIDGAFDPAMTRSALGGGRDGVLAEQVVLEERGAVRFPAAFTFEEAATLPCAAVTAWVALTVEGQLQAGETVLAMGTGGVSIFALQLAKLAGARVILTSSDDDKLARGKALGADDLVQYVREPDWDSRARELTGGRGVDHVLEVGGAGTLRRSLRAVRDGGHVAIVGNLTGSFPEQIPPDAAERGVRLALIHVGSVRHFEALNEAIARGGVRPVIDRIYRFDEARAAYEYLSAGRHFGKVVVALD